MPYLKKFYAQILANQESKLILFGPQQAEIDMNQLPSQIEMYRSLESFVFKYFSENVYA
jgi:electron transfer flavoprotein alpha/beta subunit